MITEKANNTYAELFDYAISIECRSVELYKKFLELFAHIPKASEFWTDLVKDEEIHRNSLQNIHGSLTQMQLAEVPEKDIFDKAIEIKNKLDKINIDEIKNLDQAYELAHDLEYHEIEALFKFLTGKYIAEEKKAEIVIQELDYHMKKLAIFSNEFGDSTVRKQYFIKTL